MINIDGKYSSAKIYTENIEEKALEQIQKLCNQEISKDSKIRIMPDTHAGASCTIGTTMTIADKVVPAMVGVDIGCGMETIIIENENIDLQKLDEVIKSEIPAGFNTRENEHIFTEKINLDELTCKNISKSRAKLSIGTLGGGNHFIEMNKDSNNKYYLVIHSGSRYLGKQVAEYYQELAYKRLVKDFDVVGKLIKMLKEQGRHKEIQDEIRKVRPLDIEKDNAYLYGDDFNDYINDMKIVQKFAEINRKAIANDIIKKMDLKVESSFTTIHNYIDTDNMILRKGAISALKGEKVLIPINMRDGSLICIGKGNEDWNFSAPHGAGRLMSRRKARELIKLEDYMESMKGIYSSSVCESTIDESAFAYKPMDEIVNNIIDTVDIVENIKPVYNFKSTG